MIYRIKTYITLSVFLTCILCYLCGFAQTGPGGVGSTASNILWLKTDVITGLNDGDAVTTWSDNSGNGYNLTQSTAAYKPTYETGEINGKPIIRFNSSSTDDYLIRNPFAGFATTQITAIVVNKNNGESNDGIMSYASTANDNNFLFYNSASVNIYRNGNVNTSTLMNDNNFHIGSARWNTTGGATRYHKDGTQTYSGVLSTGASITSGGSLVLAQEQDAVGGSFDASQAHTGDYAEVILYNTFLNDAQIIIVQNYLAAKYLLTMASNDYFAYETTHGNEVAGIGRTDASNTHTDAKSADILEISSPGGLGNNEYLLFGHDNASISSWTTTEIPAGDVTDARRIAREWRFSETGDVGTVTVTLDATLLPAAPGGFTQYVFWLDSDGDFSTGATCYPLTSIGGNQYQATGINITNGDYITFGVIRTKIQFTLSNDDDFETTASVNIEISLNYPLSGNATVDYNVTGGTATGGGTDYTLAGGTATVLAGATTTTFSISLTNDVVVEVDETVIITLSNPSAGVILGTNTTHTFTIHDDDNPRKIDFALASSNGDESVTPVTLTIQINIADAVNPTTVDYSVTGGTATGGGVDYTLAAGTATIPATFTTTTISFTVNDDVIDEANETLIISLSNPTNSNIGTNTIHTYTINDNDAPPTVQFNATNSSGSESVSPVNFQVDLSAAAGQDVTVDYSVTGGTATGGGVDYTLTSGTLTILAGSTTGNISATIINDGNEELSETIIITLSNPVNATMGANTIHTYTISDNDPFGYTGPGGVGQTSNNVLWLKADAITGLSDGNDVTSWTDNSGNSNTLSQGSTTYTPRYYSNIINSKPVVRWEQADTRLRKTSFNNVPTTAVTSIFVNRNSDSNDGLISYATAADNNSYLIFNSGNVTTYRGGSNASSQVINGNIWRIITATWHSSGGNWYLYRNGTQSYSGVVGSGTSNTAGGCLAIGAEQDAVDGGYDPAQSHQGDFTEVIMYNTVLNTAQRIIVENYLSSKYGIAIANDRYAYDATHGNEVAGIGRVDASNFHLDAQGTSIVRINNPSSLDNNDYLLWGHDNASNVIPNTTDVPAGIDNRMNRVWRADKTNDVGTVTVSFDLTGFTVNSGNDLELLIDDDGVFTNATRYTTGRTWNDPIVSFTGVNFADGDYFTIASNSPASPLPVELLFLDAKCNNGKVKLSWATASETNNDYFTIERSTDAAIWQILDTIEGAGNSNTIRNYEFIDEQLETLKLVFYYRLKQTDFDRHFKYSQIIAINNCREELPELIIYPNPSKGKFNIVFSNGEEQVHSIRVYSTLGELVYYSDGFQSIIDLSNNPKGVYFVQFIIGLKNISKKIVIESP